MDSDRFDTLTRALGSGISRRQTLTVFGLALSGSALLAALPQEAAALSKKARKRCIRRGGAVCGKRHHHRCCPIGCDASGTQCQHVCTVGGDASHPTTKCNDGSCNCASEIDGANPVCTSGGACAPCTTNTDCGAGQSCVVATLCPTSGAACIDLC